MGTKGKCTLSLGPGQAIKTPNCLGAALLIVVEWALNSKTKHLSLHLTTFSYNFVVETLLPAVKNPARRRRIAIFSTMHLL